MSQLRQLFHAILMSFWFISNTSPARSSRILIDDADARTRSGTKSSRSTTSCFPVAENHNCDIMSAVILLSKSLRNHPCIEYRRTDQPARLLQNEDRGRQDVILWNATRVCACVCVCAKKIYFPNNRSRIITQRKYRIITEIYPKLFICMYLKEVEICIQVNSLFERFLIIRYSLKIGNLQISDDI